MVRFFFFKILFFTRESFFNFINKKIFSSFISSFLFQKNKTLLISLDYVLYPLIVQADTCVNTTITTTITPASQTAQHPFATAQYYEWATTVTLFNLLRKFKIGQVLLSMKWKRKRPYLACVLVLTGLTSANWMCWVNIVLLYASSIGQPWHGNLH